MGNNITLFCNASTPHQNLSYAWERMLGDFSLPFIDDQTMLLSRLSGELTSTLTIRNVASHDAMKLRCNVSVFGELVGFTTGNLTTRGKPRPQIM